MRNRERVFYLVSGFVFTTVLLVAAATVVGLYSAFKNFRDAFGTPDPDYTITTVYFDGMEFEWMRDETPDAKENPTYARIKMRELDGLQVELANEELGDLVLAPHVTKDEIIAWGGETNKIKEGYTENFLDLELSSQLEFSHGRLYSVRIFDQKLRLTKAGVTIHWPCSREELERVLGKANTVEEERRERRRSLHH